MHLDDKYSITQLAPPGLGASTWFEIGDDRGRLAEPVISARLHDGEPIRFVHYLEFAPGQVRGSHWHARKRELLIVLHGTLEAWFLMPDDPGTVSRHLLAPGSVVGIEPGCAHRFRAPERASAIELSPQVFDVADVEYVRELFERARD